MNIFALHNSAILAASYHSDRHVVKMTLETAQILSTVHHLHGNGEAVKYKPTHPNHPCVKWAAESRTNYLWLCDLGKALAAEYTKRYGKKHACSDLFRESLSKAPPALVNSAPTPFALAMPEECKDQDPIVAYRKYYQKKTDENSWMTWKNCDRGAPLWIKNTHKNNELLK